MTIIKTKAYLIVLRKYALIDVGVLLLLVAVPLFSNSNNIPETVLKALFYSGFITPVISYFEFKKSHQLPFFDNLNISLFPLYAGLLILKVIISLSLLLYV
ncbi:MAG: hypothetical protein CL666_16390 [Balneola sp.]|nr:hypothetical protein [Balneola sp.]|tara:strand:+ start:132995 stop:133297 length:303 start_codon:yes stop_codon:yes gene_type:complete